MKYFATALLIVISFQSAQSQTFEIGGLLGGVNYIGDIGSTNYINPNDIAIGALFRWNRTPRHSFRFTAMYAGLNADDANSKETRRLLRDLSFTNKVLEASAGIEFTFWEFNTHAMSPQNSPYLYTGITYFNYESLFLDFWIPPNQIQKYGNDWAFAIPMVVGYKLTVGRYMVFGVEIGARYTLTDNLDGSNPTGQFPFLKFGNFNNNDWYVFTGINLTVMFGRKPCYCTF